MLSKYIVQAMIAAIQAIILVAVFVLVKGTSEYDGVIIGNGTIEMMVTIFITIYVSAGFGLLISAASKNGDRAMTIAPFVLIIQLLFSGILFSLDGATEKISYFTFSRWSMEALGSTNALNDLEPVGQEDAEKAEEEALEEKEEMVEDMNEFIADMQDGYDEQINNLQDQLAVATNTEIEPYESEPAEIEMDEDGNVIMPETDGEDSEDDDDDDDKKKKDKDEDEEEDEMFVREAGHTLKCWFILFGVTFLFAGVSILILTRLKNEQR